MCGCVLAGILVAGLWPFHAPINDVSWTRQDNGLRFGGQGSIVTAGMFKPGRLRTDSPCSLEILLQPGRVDSGGTILAYYWPGSRVVPFALRQFVAGLELQGRSHDRLSKPTRIYVDDIFSQVRPIFLAVSSGETGTAIYVDGVLVRKSATFRLSSNDLTGQLVIGNGPSTRNDWTGMIGRLAVYDRELTAAEVSQDFAAWKGEPQPRGLAKGIVASYLFDEGKGNVVRNQVDSSTDLSIPERYFVIDERFLERPWSEFHPRWSYWKDVAINIAGFVPFGFVFYAYFFSLRGIKRPTYATIAFGFVVSLTIEVSQAFLPSRDSGMTDLFTNTSGTALGAMLCAWALGREWLTETRIASPLAAKEGREEVRFLSN